MSHRINGPGNMPYEDGAYEHAEHHDAKSGLRGGIRRFAGQPCHGESGAEEQRYLAEIDPDQPMIAFERDVKAIAQDVLGVALVNSEAREFRLGDQNPPQVAP